MIKLIVRLYSYRKILGIDDESIFGSRFTGPMLYLHQQYLVENPVPAIAWLVGEIQLRRQNGFSWCLHLYVQMAGAAGINSRHNGFQAKATLLVGVLVSAQPEAAVVVLPGIVGMPPIQQGAGYGLSIGLDNPAA